MRKNMVGFSILLGTLFCVSSVMAEESGAPFQEGMENRMKLGKGGMMQHNKPSMIATNDGGVVVLDGPRLLKYDAQLNLVGQAELKPGKKGPQTKRDEERPAMEDVPPMETAPTMDEPAIELPAIENPA